MGVSSVSVKEARAKQLTKREEHEREHSGFPSEYIVSHVKFQEPCSNSLVVASVTFVEHVSVPWILPHLRTN